MIRKIDHVVITTRDVAVCVGFYKKLGFEARNVGSRWELYAGDFKINVHCLGKELLPHAQNVQVGSGDFCFEMTENIEDCKRELENEGLKIELGVVERHGVLGKMKSIYLRDPDGNLVELCGYE